MYINGAQHVPYNKIGERVIQPQARSNEGRVLRKKKTQAKVQNTPLNNNSGETLIEPQGASSQGGALR